MKKIKQPFILLGIVFSVFLLQSCLEKIEIRTQDMEKAELRDYVSGLITNGYNVDTTELGIYYIVIEEGEGVFPKQSDTLTVGYAGYFIDGSMFDSSEINNTEGSITFHFIDDPMIPGFEDGIKLMNKGSKIQMIIPSELAYGEYGTLNIPPFSTLVFVVRMIDIKPVD